MSQKWDLERVEGKVADMERVIDVIKSRLSSIEERLIALEIAAANMQKAEQDTVDLSQVPVDTSKKE